jgi:rod shape-determining protein MreD
VGAPVLLLLTFLAAAVPDLAPRALGLDRFPPDLFVGLVAYLALRGRGEGVVLWACLVGVAKDAASLDPLGTHAFVLGALAWLLARDEGRGRGDRRPLAGVSRAVAVAGAVLLAQVLYAARTWPVGGRLPSFGTFLEAFPVALSTAVVLAPLFALLDRTGALDDLAGRTDALRA